SAVRSRLIPGSNKLDSHRLRPEITLAAGDDIALAYQLHHRAHALCFIANSLNFPVSCEAVIIHE
ncbi:OsmC family protein, partial [Cobetia marina]